MKQLLTFIQKEFYHILRDRWSTIILLLLPIVMLILFGFMMTTEVRNIRFAIFDPSRDEATREIVNKISMSEYFICQGYLDNPGQIDEMFRKGETGLILVFRENFYENLLHTGEAQIQLIADGSDPNTASTLVMYATQVIASYQQDLMKSLQSPIQIHPEVKLLYNPTLKGAYNFVPGVMGMVLMLICAMMTSVSIAREKETGTMEVLLVSPMRPFQIIISKVVPFFFLSVINLTTILILAYFIMDVPIRGSLGLLILVSLIFIVLSLSLGLLISSGVDKQMTALLISGMVLMLPVIMLSGLMFPIENMPWFLRVLSQIIPAKWYILAIKKIMIQGVGIAAVAKELIILSFMTVLLMVFSIRSFKYRLE